MLMTDEVASSPPVVIQAFIAIGGGGIWNFLMNDEPEVVKRHNNRNEGNGSIQNYKTFNFVLPLWQWQLSNDLILELEYPAAVQIKINIRESKYPALK